MQHQAFVGRAHELARIDRALAAALESRGRLVLVGGEAGIGKTRLAEELATRARGRGAAVLWGHCWEDGGAPTFWPWVQVLGGCLRDPATHPAALAFVAAAPHVDRLVRETLASSAPSPQSAATVAGRAEHERFAVLDAVTNFLRAIAETIPLCIVLDDLHGADEPSLILLRLVADEVRNMRALVLGTYRDPELHEPAGVDRLLADLTRHGDTLTLRGLAERETADLIGAAGSAVPEPEEVRRFHEATAGNPLFLHELLGALEDLGHASPRDSFTRLPFSLSGRVQDLITRRLKLLPTTTREALAVAALLGPEFDAGVLAAVLEIDEQGVLARLALAQAAGVAAYVGGTVSTYRFRNALWRKALNDALSVERRIALHDRIGETLER